MFDPLENALIMIGMAQNLETEATIRQQRQQPRRAAALYTAAAQGYEQAAYLTERGPDHIYTPATHAAQVAHAKAAALTSEANQ